MKCMNCAHYKICKSLNNTGIFAAFPDVDDCFLFEPNPEHEVKEDEKKFGIALVKEENDGKKDVITEKIIESHLSNNENLIDNLLKILVNYQVTPVATGDIISDFKKCPELIFSMTK